MRHYPRIAVRTAASIDRLMEIKNVTEDDAREIRSVWHHVRSRSEARALVDEILRTCGVEYLGLLRGTDASVYHANAGDTYATTVLFVGTDLRVACLGDYLERDRIRVPEWP